ncbi:MFS transporter [Pseudactinotalea sp. HY160]|uniref:MFS transporter n=1 Tax=Pseudactinotalea sp. HY160 TaxID=2654490 RepID=UPI00128BAA3E|nr:MFS transporter [Pseudactinotalea sp. HY160]MPV48945.1 MFS transporter [Pseudactinotalea sp. HY160]
MTSPHLDARARPPQPVPPKVVRAWGLWDFGQQAFNTVILTFVFSVYLTDAVASDPTRGAAVFSNAQAWAGLVMALLAPALGSWGDRVRNSRLLLAITTAATIACMALLWFTRPEDTFLVYGAVLVAAAGLFSELAGVFYNAILLRISTPATYGRISGFAWGLGYLGGVLALVITLFGFVLDDGLLGLPTENMANMRAIALLCAGWFLVFGLPLLVLAPKDLPREDEGRFNLAMAYGELARRVAHLWRNERRLLHFFVAAAVYRDGLSAVFAFAGVLAASAYGFSTEEVIYFGLAANLIAGVSTWLAGRADDRFGPRAVIITCLVAMVALGSVIAASGAPLVFWICGMAIAALVGPVQSASRSALARMSTAEQAGENFGLYATSGRAISFLAPALYTTLVRATDNPRMGILGILAVLLAGLLVFLPLRLPRTTPASPTTPHLTD